MTAKRITSTLLVITSVTILVVLAFRVGIGATVDSIAMLRTTGMTCGSCASKISKALESVKGVALSEVDVNGGWVVVGYDTKTVKPETLAETVTSTGYYSQVTDIVTPEEFKKVTGRNIGQNAAPKKGCCGGNGGGCGSNNKPS
jgi:copper chaperone CopZ